MKLIQTLLIFKILLLFNVAQAQLLNGIIKHVTDGDSVIFLDENNITHKIRITPIDAPEKKGNQKFGKESHISLIELCEGKNAIIDLTGDKTWDREVAYLYCDKVDASIHQLRNGMAMVYDQYVKKYEYYNHQNFAKKKKIGIWSEDYPLAPWDFRNNKNSMSVKLKSENQKLAEEIEKLLKDLEILNKRIYFLEEQIQESEYVNTDELFDCTKKNCSQVLSCDEAYYKLEQCSMTQLDRNNNGIPCESICK